MKFQDSLRLLYDKDAQSNTDKLQTNQAYPPTDCVFHRLLSTGSAQVTMRELSSVFRWLRSAPSLPSSRIPVMLSLLGTTHGLWDLPRIQTAGSLPATPRHATLSRRVDTSRPSMTCAWGCDAQCGAVYTAELVFGPELFVSRGRRQGCGSAVP